MRQDRKSQTNGKAGERNPKDESIACDQTQVPIDQPVYNQSGSEYYIFVSEPVNTLGKRLGISTPESPLKWKLRRLQHKHPSTGAESLEEWLVDVANSRGAKVVRRRELPTSFAVPEEELSNEEIAVGLLLPCLADEPQMLRLSAQFISRGNLDMKTVLPVAIREGAIRVLINLAEQASRVAPENKSWRSISSLARSHRPLKENVIHWTRLAEPVMPHHGVHTGEWRLVA